MDDADVLLDVDHNAFFRALQTRHHKLWQQAQANCWTVCIPKPSIANSLRLTKEVIEHHLFRPSPIYKGQYVSLGSKPIKLEFQDSWVCPIKEEYPKRRIIYEEAFYNENFEPFKVYCIDGPIGQVQRLGANDNTEMFQLTRLHSGPGYVSWLSENIDVEKFKESKKLVQAFNSEYLTAKGYVHYVQEKLKSLWTDVLMKIQGSHRSRAARTSADVTQFWEEAAECLVLVESHEKLRHVYWREGEAKAQVLRLAMAKHQQSPSAIAVPSMFSQLDLTQPVAALKELHEKPSRLDKDAGLQEVVDLIFAAGELHNVQTGDKLVMTSDDLIPLLSKCILVSQAEHLFAELSYLKDLRFSDSTQSSQSHFNLVTFEAALMHCLSSYDLSLDAAPSPDHEHLNKTSTQKTPGNNLDTPQASKGSPTTTAISQTPSLGSKSPSHPDTSHGSSPVSQNPLQGRVGSAATSMNRDTPGIDDTEPQINLPQLKSSVTTTDGKAPTMGGLLSRFASDF
eukprot:m.65437 g.65437  ORF g.65437 m.65437 type:complete len:509 (-) comp13540_c0_seq1:440-1966(-)